MKDVDNILDNLFDLILPCIEDDITNLALEPKPYNYFKLVKEIDKFRELFNS